MDPPVLNDYHRYLMQNFMNPPAYTEPQAAPQVASANIPPQINTSVPQAPGMVQEGESPYQTEKPPDPHAWSLRDKILQGVFAAESAYDAYDTNRFLKADPTHIEQNPLLGNRPSAGKLAAFTAIGQALAAYGVDKLPSGWPRTAAQLALIAQEGSVIAGNKGVKPLAKFWSYATGNNGK